MGVLNNYYTYVYTESVCKLFMTQKQEGSLLP